MYSNAFIPKVSFEYIEYKRVYKHFYKCRKFPCAHVIDQIWLIFCDAIVRIAWNACIWGIWTCRIDCRVGCIFRTVWGHPTLYFRFVRTLQWLLFKMILFLSELHTYGCEIQLSKKSFSRRFYRYKFQEVKFRGSEVIFKWKVTIDKIYCLTTRIQRATIYQISYSFKTVINRLYCIV